MVKKMMTNVLVALVALATILDTTKAEVYHVGDDMGWTIPPNGADDYTDWSDDHNPLYLDQDSIIFDFQAGEQDVALVTKQSFESCTATNPFWQSSDPAWISLPDEGTFYFICTLAGHCEKGQKISLTWINAPSSSSMTPTPSSSKVNSNAKLPRKFFSKRVGKQMNMKIVSLNQSGSI